MSFQGYFNDISESSRNNLHFQLQKHLLKLEQSSLWALKYTLSERRAFMNSCLWFFVWLRPEASHMWPGHSPQLRGSVQEGDETLFLPE